MVIGDKNRIAVDVNLINENSNEGKLFMYVSGIKFGSDFDDYDVKRSVRNILDCFNVPDINFQNLFNCPINVLFDAYAKAIDSELWLEEFDEHYFSSKEISSPVDKFYNNFMRDYALENHLDHLCFRLGEYTFDFDEIYIIPNNQGQLRVCAKNRREEFAESIVDQDDFINIWQTVYSNLECKDCKSDNLS